MRYNVAQLLKSTTGATRTYKLHEDISNIDPAVTPLTSLDGSVNLIRTGDGILAMGDLYTTIELTCSRCLEVFSKSLRFRVEEEFIPTIDLLTGARLPLAQANDTATIIDSHHVLDLTEVVRQDLILAVPMHAVCRSGCKGLCPNCGQDWNEGDCKCAPQELDPRLAALRQLLEE